MITEREIQIYRDLRALQAPAIGAAWGAKCLAKFLAGPFHSDIVETAAMLRNMSRAQLLYLTGLTPRKLTDERAAGFARVGKTGAAQ